jgi:chromosome segregation protein
MISGELKSSSEEQIKAMYSELSNIGTRAQGFRELSNKIEQSIKAKRKEIESYTEELNDLISQKNNSQAQLYKSRSKLEVIVDYKNNKSNLFFGTKTIMRNKQIFSGIHDIVSGLIQVDVKYQTAIETVLQNSLQHVVVDNSETAIRAIKFLKDNRGGRATFIPLSTIQSKHVRDQYLYALQTQQGFIDVASNIVKTKTEFITLKEFLLGNIIVVNNIQDGNQISKLIDKRYMIVTLDGDVIRIGGVMSGGQRGPEKHMLNLDIQIKEHQNKIANLENEVDKYKILISQKEIVLSEAQSLISEFYIEQAKIKEKLESTEDNFSNLKITYENASKKKVNISEFTQSNEDLVKLQSRRTEIQQQLKVKRHKIMDINNELATTNIRKTELEKLLRNLVNDSSEQMTQKAKAEFYIQNSLQRLSEAYEITLDFAIQNYKLTIKEDEARDIVATLRKEIKDLGYINIDALKQFEEIKERHDELNANKEELDKAQQLIISAITEMDQIMIVKFDETIKGVQVFLQPIFERMFGGGEIKLRYTDPQNILETGIDVIAQPPGKTVRNLKLFSGGEKSLIAISLLFAILKYKPLPLCILDEVEAALDEANVTRYANFLQELKGKTQFMVITHRIGTMERVDELFGITMQQRGVTSIFSLKLENAHSLLNKEKEEN